MSRDTASDSDEIRIGSVEADTPVRPSDIMEKVLQRDNLIEALKQVRRNKGAPGVDGMSTAELPQYLKEHWVEIRSKLLSGQYIPSPVKRIEIPKLSGGRRPLGIPTVIDRLIQQAIGQVLQPMWEPDFSPFSFGFRPNCSAHQAVLTAREYIRCGYRWVVDMDLERFFDRVNHDLLMHKIKRKVDDDRLLRLINRFLKSGVIINGTRIATTSGVPQGGPLSPLLSNILLNDLDRELARRGHRFVRYADDCNIYVTSKRAGERVFDSITGFTRRRLKLQINRNKSAVDRPWKRTFLGFTFTRPGRRPLSIRISNPSIATLKMKVRKITSRTRGRKLERIISELGVYLRGWKNYFRLSETTSAMKDLDKWIRRRLRCYQWKQWGRSGYRQLRKRGISPVLAWNTAKSAHGPWRLSQSPALSFALPLKYFVSLGLVLLFEHR